VSLTIKGRQIRFSLKWLKPPPAPPDGSMTLFEHLRELRYRLVPYYYSLAHEAAEKGTPVMRPLAMAFPEDPKAANVTDQWLMGPGLMAAPVLTASSGAGDEANGTRRNVYFPKGTWYVFGT